MILADLLMLSIPVDSLKVIAGHVPPRTIYCLVVILQWAGARVKWEKGGWKWEKVSMFSSY